MKKKAKIKPRPRKVKEVVATGVVRVRVPRGTLPVVAHHPEVSVVEIIPVPKPVTKKLSWWDALFGTEKYNT